MEGLEFGVASHEIRHQINTVQAPSVLLATGIHNILGGWRSTQTHATCLTCHNNVVIIKPHGVLHRLLPTFT